MYIDQIELQRIRGFSHLKFDLRRPDGGHAGWTVFTGDNGSGKSSLLKALAVALAGKETARALQPSFQGWISDGQADGRIEVTVLPERGVDDYSSPGKTSYKAFPATLLLRREGRDTAVDTLDPKSKLAGAAWRGLWSTVPRGWFACGYGPFRRVFGASQEATRLMVGASTERFVTMFHEAASLFEVDQWLKNLSHKSLEGKAEEREQRDLLLELLRDELMPNQITIDRVDSDGLWLKDRNGLRLAWGDVSDGYRSALALLADILRHLIKAYGFEGLAERDAAGKLRIVRSGVVMIDEVDAHLHPEWQREIGFWLKNHFPNIQFLVTTHSPIICQAADQNGLFVLPEPGASESPRPLTVTEYQQVITSWPDTILRSAAFGLQNTRSPRAVLARAGYARLKSKLQAGATLTAAETAQMEQLALFSETEEGP